MLGAKWLFNYEIRVTHGENNRLEVDDPWNPAPVRFSPAEPTAEVNDALRQIAQRAVEGKLVAQNDPAALAMAFKEDPELLRATVERLDAARSLPARGLPLARYTSFEYAFEELLQTTRGYQRKHLNGQVDFFDAQGRLLSVEKNNGEQRIVLSYDTRGRLLRVADNWGKVIEFEYTPRGLVGVAKGRHPAGVSFTTRFEYDRLGRLVRASTADDCGQEYAYQGDGMALTKATEADGTAHALSYEGASEQPDVITHTNRGGDTIRYVYDRRESATGARVTVTQFERGKQTIQTEYRFGRDSLSGLETVASEIVRESGRQKRMDMRPGSYKLVQRRVDLSGQTTYAYDNRGRVVRETLPAETIRYAYFGDTRKLTLIETTRKSGEVEWKRFSFYPNGNFQSYRDSKGRSVSAEMDGNYLLRRIVDTRVTPGSSNPAKTVILNVGAHTPYGKPGLLAVEGVGKVDVSYDAGGKITTVKTENDKVAGVIIPLVQFLISVSDEADNN